MHAHSAFDTETCNSLTQAGVPDGDEDIPVALRLKLVDGQITEVESIVARPGDLHGRQSAFCFRTPKR